MRSTAVETNFSGTRTRTFGHLPFGDTWYETTPADKWKFTGYERDSGTGETGLDNAQARYYSSGLGGFMSPDPLSGSIGNPQSLNRYAYVMNNPVNMIDPSGMMGGNFRCKLLDTGDCEGGDYAGAGFGWMDPMGMWGGESNGMGGCSIDGIASECGIAAAFLGMDAAAVCPSNDCSLRYDSINGWVQPLRTGPNGTWQMYEPGFEYYDDGQSTEGNPNGFGYRNGRWVGYTPVQMPQLQPISPTVGPPPGPIVTAPPEPLSLQKKTNSHSYLEFLACTIPDAITNSEAAAIPFALATRGMAQGLLTGNYVKATAAVVVVAALLLVPAIETRHKCNEIVGGVIPKPF